MNAQLIQNNNYLRTIVDTMPSGIFVINDGFNILDLNPAAKELFKIKSDVTLHRLCGEVLHCKNSIESGYECGTTKLCTECVLRNSVESACIGEKTHKKKFKMDIELDGVL